MFRGSDQEATLTILRQHSLENDTTCGKTKIFIRSPKTLTFLEQARAGRLPLVAVTMQRVSDGVCVCVCVCDVGEGVCE